jgi:hypothetical protein
LLVKEIDSEAVNARDQREWNPSAILNVGCAGREDWVPRLQAEIMIAEGNWCRQFNEKVVS